MKKLYTYVYKIERYAAIICLVLSVSIIFIAAIFRAIGKPINGSMDIALFLFAWSTFLGADVAYKNNRLVNVDIVTSMFPKKLQLVLKVICYIIILVFLASLIYFGIIMSIKSRVRSFQGIPSISYSWVTVSVPVGALFMVATTLEKMVQIFADTRVEKKQTTNIYVD